MRMGWTYNVVPCGRVADVHSLFVQKHDNVLPPVPIFRCHRSVAATQTAQSTTYLSADPRTPSYHPEHGATAGTLDGEVRWCSLCLSRAPSSQVRPRETTYGARVRSSSRRSQEVCGRYARITSRSRDGGSNQGQLNIRTNEH